MPSCQEADWAREFLISLQDMYAEEVPAGMVPHLQHQQHQHQHQHQGGTGSARTSGDGGSSSGRTSGSGSGGAGSSLRYVSHSYCSALLQALTAASSDLRDMYEAQFSCLQQSRLQDGAVFVEIGSQQVRYLRGLGCFGSSGDSVAARAVCALVTHFYTSLEGN
jgi:hypothetical protein